MLTDYKVSLSPIQSGVFMLTKLVDDWLDA